MKRFCLLLLACIAVPVSAQLEIPGWLEEDAGTLNEAPAIYLPAPQRAEGLHSQTNRTDAAPPADVDLHQDARTMLRMMEGQAFQGQPRFDLQENLRDRTFLSGPTNLVVSIDLLSGETQRGVLRNQPILLKSSVGRMALLLHEIERMERIQDSPVFQVDMLGGDVVTGEVATAYLQLVQPDGGTRRVPVSRWRSVTPRK